MLNFLHLFLCSLKERKKQNNKAQPTVLYSFCFVYWSKNCWLHPHLLTNTVSSISTQDPHEETERTSCFFPILKPSKISAKMRLDSNVNNSFDLFPLLTCVDSVQNMLFSNLKSIRSWPSSCLHYGKRWFKLHVEAIWVNSLKILLVASQVNGQAG